MNRKAVLIVIILFALVLFGIYKLIVSRSSLQSGLRVVSTPTTSIYLNEKLTGKTPLEIQDKPGEYVLKMIPEDPSSNVTAWQGKVILNPSVLTYVKKELGTSELKTAGEILYLEKINQSIAEVSVSVQPDGANVFLDGAEKGISPLVLQDVIPGEHEVSVTSPGFNQRSVRIQATNGYRLNVNFQLALISDTTSETSPSASIMPEATNKSSSDNSEPEKPYVLIKDTPTGFLRVRSGPNLSATESAQIKPGEKYHLLEEQEGWFKINLKDNKDGWISSRYSTKVE